MTERDNSLPIPEWLWVWRTTGLQWDDIVSASHGYMPRDGRQVVKYVPATALEAAQARIAELEARTTIKTHDGAVAVLVSDAEIAATARREALEEAAKEIDPTYDRPCDCTGCYCGNMDAAAEVAAYDEAKSNARRIRALMENPNANG